MRRALVLLSCLAATACAHYAPAPPQPERFAAAFDARRLPPKPAGHVWSGADLLSVALDNNPTVAEAAAKYRAAVRAVDAANTLPNVSLTLTAEYARERPTWGYSGGSDIPLDIGARRSTRIGQTELQALQALYDYQDAIWKVRTDLAKARADLAGAEAEIRLAAEAADLRRERADRFERRVAAGHDDRFQQLVARNELIAAERRAADAQARRSQAVVSLAKALGVSTAAAVGMTIAAAPLADVPDLSAWRRDAALSRRDVLRAVADYDLAENALRLEVAKQYPDIHLGPGYTYDHGLVKAPISLALLLPPPDLNRAAIRQAEAARVAAGRSLETAQAGALAAVDTAAAALAAANQNVERTRTQDLPTAERIAAATARQLRGGESDRVDELGARAAALEAQVNVIDAERTSRNAAADLEDALRRDFDPATAAVLAAHMNLQGDAQ